MAGGKLTDREAAPDFNHAADPNPPPPPQAPDKVEAEGARTVLVPSHEGIGYSLGAPVSPAPGPTPDTDPKPDQAKPVNPGPGPTPLADQSTVDPFNAAAQQANSAQAQAERAAREQDKDPDRDR
jgi:hypothetical protein